MCGIVGVFAQTPISFPIIKNMTDALFHRGPDGEGYVCSHTTLDLPTDGNVQAVLNLPFHLILSHRRLSIHDFSNAGKQPMCYLQDYWITFNGEIYNFIELKAELISKGYSFFSQTDTEVILAAYDYWGESCVEKFNGEWAFIILDLKRNIIFISRDRFGIRPLYYCKLPGILLFASEIKALLKYPQVKSEVNLPYIRSYIKSGPKEYIGETAFANIFHLDFASNYTIALSHLFEAKNFIPRKYWRINPNTTCDEFNSSKIDQYQKKYFSLLEDAVRIRLRAEVKVGANLSGGLDSSSIVYLMNKNLLQQASNNKLETFSSTYQTPGTEYCDESENINLLTSLLKITSKSIEPSWIGIPQEHRKMIYYLDTPPESTLMSSWFTARLIASHGFRVTLTGEGADEQLAGYYRYIVYFMSLARLRSAFYLHTAFKKIPGAKLYAHIGLLASLSKSIFGKRISNCLFSLTGRAEKIYTHLNEKLVEDLNTLLVNLHHIDERVFMAFSIEHRSPFMDHRLVEFLASIPASYKLAFGKTKYLGRKAFDNLLPSSIIWNDKKLGWPIPEIFWFNDKLKDWLLETIKSSDFLQKNNYFSIRNFTKTDLVTKIRLLNIAIWHSVFFEDKTIM